MSVLLLTTLLFFQGIAFPEHIPSEQTILEEGSKLEADGRYEEALKVWAAAAGVLEIPSLAIGREYIRLATEHSIRKQYETASALYLWGLAADEVAPNHLALEKELAMLKPLMSSIRFDNDQYKEWKAFLEQKKPILYRYLREFWQEMDPTPGTRYNERLIEHWERIAYAREHFDRRNDPPYGTDDRGAVYVQYGSPDRQQSGYLTLASGAVYSVCKSFNPRPDIPTHCNFEYMPELVMTLDPNPYYEIWIYDKPSPDMQFNLIKIFGEKSLQGFGQVDKLEDFIPNEAFTLQNDRYSFSSLTGRKTTPGNKVTPGMIMQWMYYRQLATTDFFFASRFNDMAFNWLQADPTNQRLGKFQGPVQIEQSRIITLTDLKKAPPEQSTYEKEFPSIPLQAFHYRLLDEQRRPVTATFLESRPGQVFLDDLAFNEEVLFPHDTTTAEEALGYYELSHGLVFTSETGEVLTRSVMPAELILDFQEDLPSSTVFTVPQSENGRQLTLYAELHNRHPDSAPRLGNTPFSQALRGLGKLESELPEPLSTDPATLEMADLVLGWQMREDAPEGTLFPFVVANNREIPEGEELAVHLEIYNLQRGVDGFTDFRIDYEVQPVLRMEWLRGREQEFSLTLDQRTTQTRFIENLEIRTRELPPGRYRLKLAATDKLSGQQVEREMEFRVVESVERETVSVN